MANAGWAWKPGKQAKRAKAPDTALRVQGSPRTTVPHHESTTERADPCPSVQGPGTNVSDVLRGVNGVEVKMLGRFTDHFKQGRRARRAARVARLKAMGRH